MNRLVGGLILAAAMCGCGESSGPVTPPAPDQPAAATDTADLKNRLEQVAASGMAGSGIASIRGGVESLGKPELTKLVDELQAADSAGDASKVKSIAKQLAGKL